MTIVYIIMIALGCYFLLMGLKSRKERKLRLVNENMLGPVSKEDREQYAVTLGRGWEVMGLGFVAGATVNLAADTVYGWIVTGLGFITGVALMVYCDYRLKKKQRQAAVAKEQKRLEEQQKKEQRQNMPAKKKKKKK